MKKTLMALVAVGALAVSAVAVPAPVPVGRFRFFLFAISLAWSEASGRAAQVFGTPGYLNSTGWALIRAASRPSRTITMTPIRVAATA